jgi:DNA polymerase III alpha subunit
MVSAPYSNRRNIGWPYAFPVENVTPAMALKKKRHKTQVVVAGLIMVRQMPGTAKGKLFITLEDETGTLNLVVRPDTHARYKEWMTNTSVVCVCAGGCKKMDPTRRCWSPRFCLR